MHIAMWSGPRNLSTAMMYSFGARSDFDVVDEPFYGAYLKLTGADHPMRDQILGSMSCDPVNVAASMTCEPPKNLYSKQMTHHMIDGIPRDWFRDARHVFLIRHPARVIASYAAKRAIPSLDDLGFRQQAQIFDDVRTFGQNPVIVDSSDIRTNPEQTLMHLCAKLDLTWEPSMLSWQRGGHPCDGVWAEHWYGAVHASTGFADAEGPLPDLPKEFLTLLAESLPIYEELYQHRIR